MLTDFHANVMPGLAWKTLGGQVRNLFDQIVRVSFFLPLNYTEKQVLEGGELFD